MNQAATLPLSKPARGLDGYLRDQEVWVERPVVVLKCTHGASKWDWYPVRIPVDELRESSVWRPCNTGACQNRECQAFRNWTADEVAEELAVPGFQLGTT